MLDNFEFFLYDIGHKQKVVRKRSTQLPLPERAVHRLRGRLKKELWKVAFEPGV